MSKFVLYAFQSYPVIDVLMKYDRGVIKGSALAEKLQQGVMYTREERMFMIKILAKYLMEKCTV